jgi:predicted CXXCH cytochrome family protein
MKNASKIALLILLPLICGVSCKSSDRHRVLTFFFDGVPERGKDSVMIVESSLSILENEPDSILLPEPDLFASNHEPYREKKCTSCHNPNDLGSLVSDEPGLCYTCHENYSEQFIKLHGPVDAGFCSPCHLPHMSRHEHLQVAPGNDLCTPCHVPGGSVKPAAHRNIEDKHCISCHDPHGAVYRNIQQKPIPLER